MTEDRQNQHFQIAIDGPVASGKGTVSKKLAERLGFLYVDTGATYRVATLLAMRQQLDFESLDQQDPELVAKLVKLLEKSQIEMHLPLSGEKDGRLITLILDGEDVSWAIREESISAKVYIIAKIPQVREVMVHKQQQIAASTNVVMEGRDITYRVLPQAQLKIYLDAPQEVRIARRIDQLNRQGQTVDEQIVAKEIINRDHVDMNRQADPLRIEPDAWYLDSGQMSIDETVDKIVDRAEKIFGLNKAT